MPRYRYSPLSQKTSAIRLLRLLPSKNKSECLQCELFEMALHVLDTAHHPYEALSYVWGSEEKPKSITIKDNQKDDQELAVTQNLYTALLRLRDYEIPRIIWVDAVCINQAKDEKGKEKEKEDQIKFMPAIYAKASRVIVWLGEAYDNSDQAFQLIRIAAEKSTHTMNTQLFEVIQRLLKQPWFYRIWVLQEMAAARHILIMCGSAEIDGHVFCLGVGALRKTSEDSICQVAYLIQQAIFRSRHMSEKQDGSSLNICSLGELVDMYHTHEATRRHDKVYALLGMSKDNLSGAGLKPNYEVSWNTLMRSLIKFLLGDYASVETWDNRERAVIKGKGCVLGQVSSVKINPDNRREITYVPERGGNHNTTWTLLSSAKPIKKGDVICLLQGAQKPTIVRPCEDYLAVTMIAAIPLEPIQTKWSDLLKPEEFFTRDFLLVWDWENSLENLQDSGDYNTLIQRLPKVSLECQLNSVTRIWNLAQILGDSGQYKEAREKERQATEVCKKALGAKHLHTIESQYNLIPLSVAARMGYNKVVALLFVKDRVYLDSKDWNGRTPLSWAAGNGHKAVLKLLLEKGAELDPKDSSSQTPLSQAAENGHEAVVKLLLEKGAELDPKNKYGQTPISHAAENGHKAVLKLLLEKGAELDPKDSSSRTPLSHAAENGHEAVVKLLLEKGAELDPKNKYGRTPLSHAAANGHEAVVKLLLEKGAELDPKDWSSQTPMSQAAANGHEAVVKLLLEKGAELDPKNKYGQTPMSQAAENGHEAMVKLLQTSTRPPY